MLERGKALFERLQKDEVQEYNDFKKLDNIKMVVQINSLLFWKNISLPQYSAERKQCNIYL